MVPTRTSMVRDFETHTTTVPVVSPLLLRFPITVIHSPDMPAPSKFSERSFSWPEVQDIVAANVLEAFARSKPANDKYLAFKKHLRMQGTTVFRYLLTHTLKWRLEEEVKDLKDSEITVTESGSPLFSNASDLKVVMNDFPYYFRDDVAHLCVWTKRPILADPESPRGDISAETRALIERYVRKTFVEALGIPRDRLVWFRNWDAIQSVREISHIHVVVKGMTQEQLSAVLGGPGVPLDA